MPVKRPNLPEINLPERSSRLGLVAYGVVSSGTWTLLNGQALNENARLALPAIVGSFVAIGTTTALAWFYAKKILSSLAKPDAGFPQSPKKIQFFS